MSTAILHSRELKGVSPLESNEARFALVTAYKALVTLREAGHLLAVGTDGCDPKAADQAEAAIYTIEACMSPNLLATVLPAYTRVRFATDRSRVDEFGEGQIREGAWGLYPERGQQALERRITTTNGWEFFVTPETVFTHFEIIDRSQAAW